MRTVTLPTKVFLALSLLPALLAFTVLWLVPAPGLDGDRYAMAMRGFTNMWTAGNLVRGGELPLLWDQPDYAARLRGMYGAGFVEQMWGYPPTMLLLAVPLSFLPMFAGFLAWTVATLWLLRRALVAGGVASGVAWAAMASPASAEDILSGQNGALTAALLWAGFLLARRNPVAGGVSFGLLAVKPHLALLAPVALLASRNPKAIAAAAAASILACAAAAACFGTGAWSHFLSDTSTQMSAVMQAPYGGKSFQRAMATPFLAARTAGLPLAACWALQAAATLACAALTARLWALRDADPVLLASATIPLALLSTPYAHPYDFTALSVAVACCWAGLGSGRHPARRSMLAAAWAWPGLVVILPFPLPIPVALLSTAGVAWVAAGLLRSDLASKASRRADSMELSVRAAAGSDGETAL